MKYLRGIGPITICVFIVAVSFILGIVSFFIETKIPLKIPFISAATFFVIAVLLFCFANKPK